MCNLHNYRPVHFQHSALTFAISAALLLGGSFSSLGILGQAVDVDEIVDIVKKSKPKIPDVLLDPETRHPLRRLGSKSLVCSGCKLFMKRFQTKVARKIKGKWKEGKKRKMFEELLATVCSKTGFPKQMAVIDRNDDGQVYVDFNEAMTQIGGTLSIKKMGADVVDDLLVACEHVLQHEYKEALFERLIAKADVDGRDIDFTKFLCGRQQADVCDIDEDPSEDGEEEEL